jgi:hypothetical protein
MKVESRWVSVLGVILVLFVLGKAAEKVSPGVGSRSSDPLLPSDQPVPILKGSPACHDDAMLARLQQYQYQHDSVALAKMIDEVAVTGECKALDAGTLVFFVDRRFISGLVQVREQGSTALWWVDPSALKAGG